MSARERLEGYLAALCRRLRTHIYARAAAVAFAGALAITAATVWVLRHEEFAPAVVVAGRALLLLLFSIAALLLWYPLRQLRRDNGAWIFERRLPDENGRIQTYLDSKRREVQGGSSALLDLLAADAAAIAQRTPPEQVVAARRIAAGLALAGAGMLGLVLLLSVAPGHWKFGSRHLLLGSALPADAVPARTVVVAPGDVTVRRNSDLAISASITGFHPQQAQVFVRFADRQEWERAPMQPAAGPASRFDFKLYAVRGPLHYYVEAEGTRSGEHRVAIVDLPRIERVQLTYEYPQWTGLQPKIDDTARDIRAVEGTKVKVEVFADAPLQAPTLILDGQASELTRNGRVSSGAIDVLKPGSYRIGARVAGELVALSEDYSIEVIPDEKPLVEIRKPGRDWRATPIEEVPVRVRAQDDFRLRDVSLRYSVNGGAWQSLPLGGAAQRREAAALLDLEELGRTAAPSPQRRLVPGDLVAYYAVAKDHKASVQTDLFMVQVQPFERRFVQAQGGQSAGAGLDQEQGAISQRQREILLATWNLQRNDERNARSRQQLQDSAKMLAELQATLAQQARTLAQRTRARAAVEEDERIKTFVESLEHAAVAMDPAVTNLNEFKLQSAVPFEQQALQQLLRAETAFRDVQVSMQRGEGAGQGAQSARNFTEMFELEMDLEKSQYESESQLSLRNAQQDLEEMIRKLKELAQRQERLAEERRDPGLRTPEQRWQQEQLRREAEDLRRRLAEVNRQQSGSDSGGSQQGAAGSESHTRPERERERFARALESVNRALENMRAANGGAESDAQDAGRELRRALQQIDQREPSRFDEILQQLAQRSQRMLDEQRRIEGDLYSALGEAGEAARAGNRDGIDPRRMQELVRSKQALAGDLIALERDMRNAVHDNRDANPETARRLGEILRDIEGSDVMYRLNRSAAEIYYGRAREAAPREGLITETLDMFEQDLRAAAIQAAQENLRKPAAEPDELLAQVGELRRALQAAQQRGAPGTQQSPQRANAGRAGETSEESRHSQGEGAGASPSTGLAAWGLTPPHARFGSTAEDDGSLARQAAALSQQVRNLTYRLNRAELTLQELEMLRGAATQLRRLSGDPLAAQRDAMLQLIDQIELTALAAATRAHQAAAARAMPPAPESPRYRAAVAEYYRRLGSR